MPAPKGNKNALKNPGGGRESGYKQEFAKIAAKACELGATNFELGQMFGVSTATIIAWTHLHVEFSDAVKAGKENADQRVVRSLYHRAVGYTYESEKVFQHQGKVIRAKVIEHLPPDVGAAMNWLKNRRPDLWREKQEIEVQHSFAHLTDEELRFEILALAGEVGDDDLVALERQEDRAMTFNGVRLREKSTVSDRAQQQTGDHDILALSSEVGDGDDLIALPNEKKMEE